VSRTTQDMWQTYRREMIAETERFIEMGLRHPELVDWIPTKTAKTGGFPQAVANWFYHAVFVAKEGTQGGSWRRKLRILRGGKSEDQ
jgi:hypothetical protein